MSKFRPEQLEVITGVSNNDKVTTQGHVDDQFSAGGTSPVFQNIMVLGSIFTPIPLLDQEQVIGVTISGSSDVWQSFTPGADNYLTRIGWRTEEFASTVKNYDVRIYEGEGTGGTLLEAQLGVNITLVADSPGTWAFLTMLVPIPIVPTNKYTMSLHWNSGGLSGLRFRLDNGGNPYAGGRSSTGALDDIVFRTFKGTVLP